MPTRSAPPSTPDTVYARVVVDGAPLHLGDTLDYVVPEGLAVEVGQRVRVPFAGRTVNGLIVEMASTTSVAESRLRPIRGQLGEHRWVDDAEIVLLRWAAERFGAPLADVVRHALPPRTVDVERRASQAGWYPHAERPSFTLIDDETHLEEGWTPYDTIGTRLTAACRSGRGSYFWRPLPGEAIGDRLVELVQLTLAGDRDALVLVPDAGSAIAATLLERFGNVGVDLRAGASPRVRYGRWLRARCGAARLIVGERGAAFTPLARLGLAVIVDEANPAFKERRSPRHHAREIVLERARRSGGVGMAVGTVPSASAWALLRDRRVLAVAAPPETERARRPRIDVVDMTDERERTRISLRALRAIKRAVDDGGLGIVLASRRGDGRAFVCSRCGRRRDCPGCGSTLTAGGDGYRCLVCAFSARRLGRCSECGDTGAVPLAAGTGRIAQELRRAIDAPVTVMEGYDAPVPPPPNVLVMTRGSALDAAPGPVEAVVMPDLDAMLLRPVLDAADDTLRLAMRLAEWTIGSQQGRVVVQTRHPEHHVIGALQQWSPGRFWRHEALLRDELRFPPSSQLVAITVVDPAATLAQELANSLPAADELLGPRIEGGQHAYLVKTSDRATTLRALAPLRSEWSRTGIAARVDVDPVTF